MISLDKIREDLKDIRYYYARKKIFDSVSSDIGLSKVRDTVNLYNRTILMAPARLFDLYVCLYTKGYTQEGLSVELDLTPEYVQMQHKQLLLFLQARFGDSLDEEDGL